MEFGAKTPLFSQSSQRHTYLDVDPMTRVLLNTLGLADHDISRLVSGSGFNGGTGLSIAVRETARHWLTSWLIVSTCFLRSICKW
jgi:hypothetical protein